MLSNNMVSSDLDGGIMYTITKTLQYIGGGKCKPRSYNCDRGRGGRTSMSIPDWQ